MDFTIFGFDAHVALINCLSFLAALVDSALAAVVESSAHGRGMYN